MAKRFGFILVCAIVAAGAVFAQEKTAQPAKKSLLSAGIGGYFISDFGGGLKMSASGMDEEVKMPYAGGGGFAFLDATYAEINLGIFGGGGTIESSEILGENQDISYLAMTIGALGKYPVAVNPKLTVFPLLGIDYLVMLSAKDKDGNEFKNMEEKEVPGDFSALWIKFGGGLDYALSAKLYLRLDALYGVRLANQLEKDLKDAINGLLSAFGESGSVDTRLGHGLTAKVAVGYRF